jgi:LCP family protein required for cell wall assembly
MPDAPDALSRRSTSRRSERRSRTRARILRRLVISFVVVVALLGTAVGAGALLLHESVGKNITTLPDDEVFPAESARPPAASTGARNILLLGSDSRATTDRHDLAAAGGQRSDVVMLAHIPADRSGISITSIMRDTWVPIPGHGEAKVNAALAWGGVPLVVQTVEGLVGARIDHVAIIDFEGISGMTEALGGVTVDNSTAFTSGGRFYAAGPITVEGAEALRYVRERHAFADADYQRVRNQQALLQGILSRAISRDVLGDPAQLLAFVSETSRFLTVDAGFTASRAASLAYSLRGVDSGDLTLFTLPTAGTGTSPDGQSIVRLDPAATSGLRDALAHDTVPAFAEADRPTR